jgi:hypothetical protein
MAGAGVDLHIVQRAAAGHQAEKAVSAFSIDPEGPDPVRP